MKSVIFFKCLNYTFVALAQRQLLRVTKNKNYSLSTIMGKSVVTTGQFAGCVALDETCESLGMITVKVCMLFKSHPISFPL